MRTNRKKKNLYANGMRLFTIFFLLFILLNYIRISIFCIARMSYKHWKDKFIRMFALWEEKKEICVNWKLWMKPKRKLAKQKMKKSISCTTERKCHCTRSDDQESLDPILRSYTSISRRSWLLEKLSLQIFLCFSLAYFFRDCRCCRCFHLVIFKVFKNVDSVCCTMFDI